MGQSDGTPGITRVAGQLEVQPACNPFFSYNLVKLPDV
jgi:hypothetical protein